MDLASQLEQDLTAALRARDQIKLSVLRLLKSALKNYQIEVGHDLTAQEMLIVLQKEAKKRRDSIEAYDKAGRADLVAEESAELKTIETYLPAQMDEAELRELVAAVIQEQGEAVQIGQIIGEVLKRADGQTDGATVSRLVRESQANR